MRFKKTFKTLLMIIQKQRSIHVSSEKTLQDFHDAIDTRSTTLNQAETSMNDRKTRNEDGRVHYAAFSAKKESLEQQHAQPSMN